MYSTIQRLSSYIFGADRSRARSLANVDERFIFVHIPKNAGSSVAETLEMDMTWHYTAQAYRKMLGRPAYHWRFSFALVRNPWDRFLSLYRYARLDESRYHSALDPESAPYGKHDDYDLLQSASVEDCARYLQEGRLRHDDFINHWRPQSDWLTDAKGNVIVDFVGRVESIDTSFRTVADRIGLEVNTLPVINRSSSTEGYRTDFTDKTRDIVAEYYHEDIKRFEYEF